MSRCLALLAVGLFFLFQPAPVPATHHDCTKETAGGQLPDHCTQEDAGDSYNKDEGDENISDGSTGNASGGFQMGVPRTSPEFCMDQD
ncbi:MAG: hypothetical protein ABIJ96_03255 [Elusimicrobiota bacterium]